MSYIVNKIFIDTNILVYALDNRDNDKMNKARNILRKVIYENKPVISTQVINEFYVAATRKLNIDKTLIKTQYIKKGISLINPFQQEI